MPKLETRKPTLEELQGLVPLRQFSEDHLQLLLPHSKVLILPKGTHIRQRQKTLDWLLFLLRGRVRLVDIDGETLDFDASGARARFPLSPERRGTLDVLCRSKAECLRLPLEALQQTRDLAEAEARNAAEQPQRELSEEEQLEAQMLDDFRAAIEQNRLQLPSMPEVAARISAHIDSPKATSDSIARIVQADPSIAARLIQVSNSVALGARSPVKTCKDAVTRLGRNGTRELVTSFVLRGLFRSRSQAVKQRMQVLWRHSTLVAALCHVLARHSPGFESPRAMLIGLVHDIGMIPLLTHTDKYPGLANEPDQLDRILGHLRGEVGALTLEKWGFSEEFIQAAREAEDWFRNAEPRPDYTDLLIVAQLHAYLGTPNMQGLPRIDQVPAFEKLALGTLSPRMSLLLLDEARQEVEQVRQMLA